MQSRAASVRSSHTGSARHCGGVRNAVIVRAAAAPRLYTNPGSRGKLVEWYITETGLNVELNQVDMKAKQHKSAQYLAEVHPFGKVPALVDGDKQVFETGAIMLYLAAAYKGLDASGIADAAPWVLFANSTMCEAFFQQGGKGMPSVLETLDKLLSAQAWVTGDDFCPLSDVSVAAYCLYIPMFFPDTDIAGPYPRVFDYMQRAAARPGCPEAYKAAMAGAVAKAAKAGGVGGLLKSVFSK